MKKIDILTAARWESATNLLGTFTSPLELLTEIRNNTNKAFTITGICISVKNNFFFFKTTTDIFHNNKHYRIQPKNKFELRFDIRHILTKYGRDKKFTVKVFGNDEVFESGILTVRHLHDITSSHR